MGLFDFLKKNNNGQFVSEKHFKENVDKQITWTPLTLQQLKEIGVTEDRHLKLEFFFYSNSLDKVENLSTELETLNYEVHFGKSQTDRTTT